MKKAIIGKKIGMTQVFLKDGRVAPVTVIQAGPCVVVQKKTLERDGYEAIQVGYARIPEARAARLLNKPMNGHYKKSGVAPMRYLRELRLDNCAEHEVGGEIRVSVFSDGDRIDVIGTSKGKGTQGAIARWGLHRGPMAHGSKYHRGQGSLSANSDPSRVFKNKKMAGRGGSERVTVQNLEIVSVLEDRDLLLIRGAVPGPDGGVLLIRDTVKAKRG